MPAIRVLLVDDHSIVREGLAAIINRQDDLRVVAEAADGREALTQFRLHRPDVTLMDVRMPVMDGAEATAAIRAEFSEAVIILLTTFDQEGGIARALDAGAKTYLLKDAGREELLY